MRYAMAIDLKTCMACAACIVACKVENNVEENHSRCRVTQLISGEFPSLTLELFSERCNQCADAPCVTNCPTGASHYADGGTVLVTEAKCTGCKACIAACPYDARFINEKGYAEKCTFCVQRVRKGLQPACVSTCPSRAMIFGDLDDPATELSKLLALRPHRALSPEAGTRPHVFYLE
jgi:Fe-S-cluster-containing dehydrogenase component